MTLVKLTIDPQQTGSGRMRLEMFPVVRETKRGLKLKRPVYQAAKERFEIEEVYFSFHKLRSVEKVKGGYYARACYWLSESGNVKEIKRSVEMETGVLRIVDRIRAEMQGVANVLLDIEGVNG